MGPEKNYFRNFPLPPQYGFKYYSIHLAKDVSKGLQKKMFEEDLKKIGKY